MANVILPPGEQQFSDENGKPYVAGLVYFYIPNTLTPKDTYQDADGTILNANPVVLDSAGRAVIWGEGEYRQMLYDRYGNSIWDKIVSYKSPTSASNISITDAGGYYASNNVEGALQEVGHDTNLTGNNLTPAPSWDDVPELGSSAINAPAQALLNRFAYLGSAQGADKIGFQQDVTFPMISLSSKIRQNGLNPIDIITSAAERAAILDKTSAYDANAEIQEAINYMSSIGGGDVKFTGRYRSSVPLKLKAKVNLIGYGDAFGGGASQILPPIGGGNFPLIINDPASGAAAGTGDDGNPQRFLNIVLRNLDIVSGGTSADRRRCALKLTNAWSVMIENCRIAGHGIAAQIIDCNVVQFVNGIVLGGMLWDSVADSKIIGMEIGPINYPTVDADRHNVVLWLNGSTSWKNVIVGNTIYNCPQGVAQPATFVNGSANITVTGHDFIDETPVTLEATVNPVNFYALTTTYWVKVIDANTIKLAESRPDLLNNVFLTPASAGSDTVLRVGGRGNIFLNNGAKWNTITGNRFDQSYYSGVMLANAHGNTISSNTVIENGRGNASGQNAIRVTLSNNNTISGNTIDGATTSTSTGTSNQTIGISISSGSTGNRISGNISVNHSVANIFDSGTKTVIAERRKVMIDPLGFEVRSGTPTRAALTGSRKKVWSFPSGADGLIQGLFEVPIGYTKFTWRFRSTNLGAGSGTIQWSIQWAEYADGDDITANEPNTITNSVTAPAQERLLTSSGTFTLSGTARLLSLTVKRAASGDTLANAAGFVDMDLEAYE